MTKFFLILASILAFVPIVNAKDDLAPTGKIGQCVQQDELKTYKRLQAYTNFKLASSGFEDFPLSTDIFDQSYRSPSKSFFYSLVVPGGGQLYNQSKIKAGIFMAVELASWIGYTIYHSKGKTQEKNNISLADRYWDPQRYTNYLIDSLGISSDTMEFVDPKGELKSFTHHLPETRTQQYYEMIGKYDQFRYGWVDTDYNQGKYTSDFRTKYLDDRHTTNQQFSRAKTGAIISIVNHLLSAFDGALSAKRFNKKQDTFSQLSLKARMVKYEGERIPKLTLTYKF